MASALSVSFNTANGYSEEDEKREIEKLTEVERKEILDDVYGRKKKDESFYRQFNRVNYMLPADVLERFYEILEEVPPDKSTMLWHAWTVASEVVNEETDFALFIRHALMTKMSNANNDDNDEDRNYDDEDGNIIDDEVLKDAAIRVCEYWDMRVNIFGEEQALQPMTLDGAMKDVVKHMTLFPHLVRILPDDDHGRPVLCWDRTGTSLKGYDDLNFMKMVWFCFHSALFMRSTQENGIVILTINPSLNWDFTSRKILSMAPAVIDCFPIKVCCVHKCASPLVATIIGPLMKLFWSRSSNVGKLRFQLHSNFTKKLSMLNELEEFGLRRDNLPTTIDGNYDDKPTWIVECERRVKEQQRSSGKRQRI